MNVKSILQGERRPVRFVGIDWKAEEKKSITRFERRKQSKERRRKRNEQAKTELETQGLLQQFLQQACDSDDTAIALQGMPEADPFLTLASKKIQFDETESASKLEKLKKALANFAPWFGDERTVYSLKSWHNAARKYGFLPQDPCGGRSPVPAANDAVDDGNSGGGKASPDDRVTAAAELEIRPQDGTNNAGHDHSNRRTRTGRGYDNGYISPSTGSESSLVGLSELDKTPKNSEERDMVEGFEEKKDDDDVKSNGSIKESTVHSTDQIDCVENFVVSLEKETKTKMIEKLNQCNDNNKCLRAVKNEILADVYAFPCDTDHMKRLRKTIRDWLTDEKVFDLEFLKKELDDDRVYSPPPREVIKKHTMDKSRRLAFDEEIKDEEGSPLRPRNHDTNDLLEDPRSMPSLSREHSQTRLRRTQSIWVAQDQDRKAASHGACFSLLIPISIFCCNSSSYFIRTGRVCTNKVDTK